ncbi:MAG: hypothetical protein IJK87_08400 [Prevotella sp.]|nr:hypothetical protein [Prevotella sp.]
MKKSLQHSMKAIILAVSTLFAANTMADNVIGQPVTEFSDPATMQLDYPYTLQGSTRTLLRTKLLTFKIEVPADGLYGVEYLVNVTGNNVQLGATASTEADVYSAPDWTDFAHVTSKTDDDLVTPKNPEDEIIEDEEAPVDSTEAVEIGTPIRLYSAVNLTAGVNYVHVWMHVYWRNDNIAPQKVQFKSVRLMGQGSGEVAALAARASQKAYRVKYFTSLQDATTATMVSDYDALVSAIGNDYTNVSTAAIEADIAAAEAKEQDVRHGKGVVVTQDSTRIDLLLYHSEYNNPNTMDPLGGYDESGAYEMENGLEDYPAQLEFTRNNYFTYKFTAGTSGNWFIQYYASSNNAATIDMTILEDDSTTVAMPLYKLSTANGSWTNYELMSNPAIAKFAMEEGKTYILHMYYNQYTNVRDILVRFIPKQTYDSNQLWDLCNEAELTINKYAEGTVYYYTVADRTLLDNLSAALDQAYEALENEDATAISEAYEKLTDAITALVGLQTINAFPTEMGETFDVTAYEESKNCSYKTDGGIMQLDSFQSGGYMVYKVYNGTDAEYNVDFEFAHQSSGAQMEFIVYVNENDIDFTVADAKTEAYESTGGWQTFEPKSLHIGAIPTGYVYLKITGTGPSYVGNPRQFVFTPIEGTEGAGAIALEAAKQEYYSRFTPENLQALVNEAQEAIAPYAPGTVYDYTIIDRSPIDNVEAAIEQANEAIASGDAEALTLAYNNLRAAIDGLSTIRAYNYIPNTTENTFNLAMGDFDLWRMESGGNIGFGYANGSVTYTIYATIDAKYDMEVSMSNPAEGASIRTTVTAGDNEASIFEQVFDVPNTGSWDRDEIIRVEGIPMPQGFVKVKLYGETAAGQWVGNTYGITFTKVDGTEGEGSKALADGITNVRTTYAPARIYGINGQYMGTSFRSLPKGIYIMDGKKIVIN